MGHDSSICDMTHLREIKSALGGCARARERESVCVCVCVSGVCVYVCVCVYV